MNQQQSVENVARAFYETERGRQPWESVSDEFREQFRQYAREAINLLIADRGQARLEREPATKSRPAFGMGFASPSA